jgi:ABC-type dipeptide/oligopeptide/nickel transport system permease subunit
MGFGGPGQNNGSGADGYDGQTPPWFQNGGNKPQYMQCLQQARQGFKQAQAAVISNTVESAYIGGATNVGVQLVAGCLVGTGAGTILGGLATVFLGGEGAFAGAPVGCITGAISAVLDGIPSTVVVGLISALVSYEVDEKRAVAQYNQVLQNCGLQP